jgi:hypothetical protein
MKARFSEVEKAIAYMCEGLQACPSSTAVCVSFYQGGTQERRSTVVEVAKLPAVLRSMCRRFIGATVVFEYHEGDLPKAAIQCYCQEGAVRKNCTHRCRHRKERPIVSVIPFALGCPPSPQDRETTLLSMSEAGFH